MRLLGTQTVQFRLMNPMQESFSASDAMGIPISDKLFVLMNTNIEQFLNSLES